MDAKSRNNNTLHMPKRRRRRKPTFRVRLRRALFSTFLVAVVAVSVYFVSPISRLSLIYFEGHANTNRSELISLASIEEGQFFLFISPRRVQRQITSHPLVDNANVSRVGANRLKIEIEEFPIAVCGVVDNRIVTILNDGAVVFLNEMMPDACNERVIHGITDVELENGVVSLFATQLITVDPNVLNLIRFIEYAPKYGNIHRFSLFLMDGNSINVTSHSLAEYLNTFPLLLANIPPDVTGVFHLDACCFFVPHDADDPLE